MLLDAFAKFPCSTFKDTSKDADSRAFLDDFRDQWNGMVSALPADPKKVESPSFDPYFAAMRPLADLLVGDKSFEWSNPGSLEKCVVIEMLHSLGLKDHEKEMEDLYQEGFDAQRDDIKDREKAEENAIESKYKEAKDKLKTEYDVAKEAATTKDEKKAAKDKYKDGKDELEKAEKSELKELKAKFDSEFDAVNNLRKCKSDDFKAVWKGMDDHLDALEKIYDVTFGKDDADAFRLFVRDLTAFADLEMGKDELEAREDLFKACADVLPDHVEGVLVDDTTSHDEL
jgi:hypothetical protein